MTELYSIFSIPVLETDIGYSKESIDHIHSLEYCRTDYDNADISVSMDVLNHPKLKKYSDRIDHFVRKFCFDYVKYDKTRLKLERTSSWSNRYHPNDWCQFHNHANAFITGVWYLETPDGGGDLDLHNPRHSFGEPISFEVYEFNSYNSHGRRFHCTPGKLLVFPSIIGHSVEKNRSDKVRSCIAFNYYARGEVTSEDKVFYT